MVLARSMEDRTLADEVREAATDVALSLGPWPRRASDKRDRSRHPEVRSLTSTAGDDARSADEVIE
jgi:hypothetical protein